MFEPQSDYQPGSSNIPWRFLSVQVKTTVDHRACLFFQSLPNPPHQCQHHESYEVSRSLRDKCPAKITNKQPKRRVKNHSNLYILFWFMPTPRGEKLIKLLHSLISWFFFSCNIIFINMDEKTNSAVKVHSSITR